MAADSFQIADVKFIKRIVVGSESPTAMKSEAEIRASMDLLNRCLNGVPKGRLLGMEKNFSVLNIGEHQVVLQHIAYHVGFARKPADMD